MARATPPAKPAALRETERAQATASDPAASAWVSANAGAGKTHVLKMRVLRLLLADAKPERILCLTYTKAAAAEMSARVFADLSAWATLDETSLAAELTTLLGRTPTVDEMPRARQLFARAIETPGGLKVQTIHAFCERLLQRFPLEAQVPPGFTILDDATAAQLRREAIDAVLVAATRRPGSSLGAALSRAVAFAAGDDFDAVLARALAERKWIAEMSRLEMRSGSATGEMQGLYRRCLGVRPHITEARIVDELAGVLADTQLGRARAALEGGTASDIKLAAALGATLGAATLEERAAALAEFFLTGEGGKRARLLTKALKEAHPDVDVMLTRAQDAFHALAEERIALTVAEATAALIELADAVMQRYSEAKARRAALDFDDLIVKSAALLAASEQAEWVLYKLDGGLDHVLVDEAQDTSGPQWAVIGALASEFYTGTGARDIARTLFAVGDEKQSIYSFQGAEPRLFAATGARFQALARDARQPWKAVPLDLSFRTVAPVLATVDRTFADPVRTPGLTAQTTNVSHRAMRQGHAGLVEVWPTEVWQEQAGTDAFDPLAESAVRSPAVRLAARIADTIAGWLNAGETLVSEGRPVTAGDILILVRRRYPFAAPMIAALKARKIPVAGADRIRLTEQIAVQDLMALGEFLVLPEDDLSLAAVLKSPLIDLDDDDLIAMAPGRKGTLWKALLDSAAGSARIAAAAATLKAWRAAADFTPPFEFFASLLDRQGMRSRMLERLGPDAADPLDELLNLALAYDEQAPPSLQGFLAWLRSDAREIKRDMEHGRNAVRVMTVHGAKGLEAPIVFLPDTCAAPSAQRRGGLIELIDAPTPSGISPPLVWPVKGSVRITAVQAGKAAAAADELAENNRLLYVAMTRARDRLYVAGFEGKRGRGARCWYDTILAGLGSEATAVRGSDGRELRRLACSQTVATVAKVSDAMADAAPAPLPAWARQSARSEPQLTMPLAPSRLAPYEIDAEGEPADRHSAPDAACDPPHPSPALLTGDHRFLRGTLTHALLEHVPNIAPGLRDEAAARFVELRGRSLPPRTRASIATEALAVLRDERFAGVFGPDSRAEVPIVAELDPPHGRGPRLRVVGQIDRLAVLDDHILLIDYKTNRPPPADAAGIAPAYLYQLAAYRLALGQIFPGRPVRAAILWTDGPRLMPVPDADLAAHEKRLWTLEATRLDG